ncbi:hypothetical protein, partial [Siminovitchia fortis]|uniref:hypothetical protein n=1 Tax=Siminovitchia fortis TaxID=254758 RepID=UPI001C92F2B6
WAESVHFYRAKTVQFSLAVTIARSDNPTIGRISLIRRIFNINGHISVPFFISFIFHPLAVSISMINNIQYSYRTKIQQHQKE